MSKRNDLDSIDIVLSTFLITYKEGLAVHKLDPAYFDMTGEHIQYQKYGFSNLHSLLSALPSVSLNNSWVKAIPSEKDMHIHELVAEQKQGNSRNQKHRSHNSYHQSYTSGHQVNRNYGSKGYYQGAVKSFGYNGSRNLPSNWGMNANPHFNWGRNYSSNFNNWDRNFSNNSNNWDKNSSVNFNTSDRNSKINCNNWNLCKNEDTSASKGYISSTSSSHSPVKSSVSEMKIPQRHIPTGKLQKMPVPLSEGAARRMKLLLKQRSNGMYSDQLVDFYSELFPAYKSDVDWKEMNHNSIDDLLKTAPDGLLSRVYALSGQVRYFPGVLATSSSHERPSTIDESEELATNCDGFTQLNLKQILGNHNRMSVHVAEIYTPNKFYLNPTQDDTLLEITKEINLVLCDDRKPSLRAINLKDCMPVFVLHNDGDYYRAKIIDSSDPKEVEVFIVDYGTTTFVEKQNIYRMPKKFLQVPVQAFEARLENVKPLNGDEWENNDAAAWLMSNTSSKCTAVVDDIKSDFISIILYAAEGSLSINEGMVLAGLARFCLVPKIKNPLEAVVKENLERASVQRYSNGHKIETPLQKLAAAVSEGVGRASMPRHSEHPPIETPLGKLAASLELSSLNAGHVPPTMPLHEPIEVFSQDELAQIRKQMEMPLRVPQLICEAMSILDNCLESLIKQREECLSALNANPEREDLFNYVQALYSVIKQMRHLKEFDKTL